MRLRLLWLLVWAVAPALPGAAPNIILMVADDLRFDAVGANGNAHINTPNLDALAARSVRFDQAYVVMSLCSPSRAAILTGRYGSANGVTSLGAPLRPGETTFAQHLRDIGYRTALMGKWHIGGTPQEAGFDTACYFRSNGRYHRRNIIDGTREVQPDQHVDDYCVDRSIEFLEQAATRPEPFLLVHNTQLPHMDHQHSWPSPAEFRDRYDPEKLPVPATAAGDLTGKPPSLAAVRNRTQADVYGYSDLGKLRRHIRDYYGVVTHMDAILGRLLAAVDRLGLRENTWIIFLSDNGWFLGEHRLTSKVLAYSDSVRVPLFIAGPGVRPRAETRLALNLDIAPTVLALAGRAPSSTMHGVSLLSVVRGERTAWRELFVYECTDGYGGTPPMLAAISSEFSLIYTWAKREDVTRHPPAFVELYARKKDPDERMNVAGAAELSEKQRQLSAAIEEHIARHLRR